MGISFQALRPEKWNPFFCFLKLKFWDVEISIVSCAITRNFNPLIILVPEALRALLINYFVCHLSKEMI